MVGEGRVGPPLEIVEIELTLKPNPLFSGPEALTFGGRIGGGIKEWPQFLLFFYSPRITGARVEARIGPPLEMLKSFVLLK